MALEVLWNQWVVGGLEAVLHGQVERGRCFAAAAHAHQNDIGLLQIAVALAIVVGQREVDGFNPVVVGLAFGHIAEAPDAVVGLDVQFGLQRFDKGCEHVQKHAFAAFAQYREHLHVHQRGEDDGAGPVELPGVVDLPDRLVGLVHGVDEGQPYVAGFGFKLRQDGVAEGFGGDASAVGYEKNTALWHAKALRVRGTARPTIVTTL